MKKYWKIEFLKHDNRLPNKLFRFCLISILITWLPIVILSLIEGVFFNHNDKSGLVNGFLFHFRFILVVPMLIFSEVSATRVISDKIKFIEISDLLSDEDSLKFHNVLVKAAAIINSLWTQAFILLLVLGFRYYEHEEFSIVCKTWMVRSCSPEDIDWTYAGFWRNWISNTIFLYVFYRNILLIFAWAFIVNGFRKLSLQLSAIHPDKFGGLGFLCEMPFPFMFMTFSFSLMLASGIAGRMIYFHKELSIFYPIFFSFLVMVIIIHVLPTLSLISPLIKCKLKQRKEYSALILHHHKNFYNKWMKGHAVQDALLGSQDASSAADSNTTFEAIIKMKVIPINLKSLMFASIFSLPPLLAIFFIKYPVQDIVKFLIKILMGSGMV